MEKVIFVCNEPEAKVKTCALIKNYCLWTKYSILLQQMTTQQTRDIKPPLVQCLVLAGRRHSVT